MILLNFSHPLTAEKRRVSDNYVRRRPFRLRSIVVQHRIPALDRLQRSEDRILRRVKAVAAHPLNLADPHRHSRKLGGIWVELDPEDTFGPDAGEAPMKTERLGVEVGAVLDILQRPKRDVEEVA